MRYLLLIYVDEAKFAKLSAEAAAQVIEAYGAYYSALAEAGVLCDRAELQPSTTMATVAVHHGLITIADGPRIEIGEQIGGYCLIECDDRDQAVAWAAGCPGANHGTIEVRSLAEN